MGIANQGVFHRKPIVKQGVFQCKTNVNQPLPISGIPGDTREDIQFRQEIINHFPEKFSLCKHYAKIAHKQSKRDANLFLLDYSKLKNKDLVYTSDDSELTDWAKSKAKKVKHFIEASNSKQNDRFWFFHVYELVANYASGYGFGIPISKYGIEPVFNRLKDHRWWLRKARTLTSQEIEKRILGKGKVRKGKQIYCSDRALKKRFERRKATRQLLETLEAVNEIGDTFSMSEIYDKGVSNPKNRRSELMVRMRGFDDYAKDNGHIAKFYTLTCPSKFHPSSDKYAGYTPKEAQKYLTHIWALSRSALKRRGLEFYGFRIAEPHHDGCPHWHMVFFMDKDSIDAVDTVLRRYALMVDGSEKGASKHRFTSVELDPNKGSATGYLAKYIAKNIDGEFTESGKQAEDFDTSGSEAIPSGINTNDAALRVEAWASLWNIRQFQQIGGPKISLYRECRRAEKNDKTASKSLSAANSGDWKSFIESVLTEDICLAKKWSDKPNQYGEPCGESVFGISVSDQLIETRYHQWEIRKLIQRDSAQDAHASLGVLQNNCTRYESPPVISQEKQHQLMLH